MTLTDLAGVPVIPGQVVRNFRGELLVVRGWAPARDQYGAGRVVVTRIEDTKGEAPMSVYPAVCGLQIVPVTPEPGEQE